MPVFVSALRRPRVGRPLVIALAAALLFFFHAGSAAAAWYDIPGVGFEPGEVYVQQQTFQAPSTNLLSRLTPPTKTVTIPIHRTFAESGLASGRFPVEVDWSIGAGPPGTLSATAKEVEYKSGTARFNEGQTTVEIPVKLMGLPADNQPRQFTFNLTAIRVPALNDTAQMWYWWQVQGRELYRLRNSAYAHTITQPPSFNCELRDRLMSIQVPPGGDASWCPASHPGAFQWTRPIMVNGIRLDPAAGTSFWFDTARHTLTTRSGTRYDPLAAPSGEALPSLRCSSCRVSLGFVPGPINWTSDNSGPEKSLRLTNADLFGFPFAVPVVEPIKFTDSYSALLPTYVGLPPAIRRLVNYSTDVVMRSQNPAGLMLQEVRLHADYLPFGAFTIRPFDLYYNGAEDLWSAHVGLFVPTKPTAAVTQKPATTTQTDLRTADPNVVEQSLKVTPASPGLLKRTQAQLTELFLPDGIVVDAKLEITGAGELRKLEAGTVFRPPIPLGQPGVGLRSLSGAYGSPFQATIGPFYTEGPFGLRGTVGIAAGPAIGASPAFTFEGTLGYVAGSDTRGWELLATGGAKLFGFELASGGLRYVNGESVTVAFKLGQRLASDGWELGFEAGLEANVLFQPLDFYALGYGRIAVKVPNLFDFHTGGIGAVNGRGFSICSEDVGVGLKYLWSKPADGSQFDVFLGCNNDAVKRAIGVTAAAAASDSRSVTIPDGVPYEVLQVRGRRAAPALRIEGPGGFRFVTPRDRKTLVGKGRAVRFFQAPDNVTWVQIMRPRGGRYQVTPLGGTEIASVSQASGLPAPKVQATVTGKGAVRTLRYRVRQDNDQSVQLLDDAGVGSRVIRTVRGSSSGELRFRPMSATASPRRAVRALLLTNGTPAGRRTLARYRFAEPRVGAPRISTRARRGRVRVTWSRVRGATGYEIAVALADGQRLYLPAPARQRSLNLSTVASRQNGTVTIRAIDRLKRRGPEARARFRAARRR